MRTAMGTEHGGSVPFFRFRNPEADIWTENDLNGQFDCIISCIFAFLPGFHIARGGKTWYASIEL